MSQEITLIKGDGIGPEVVDATLRILEASGLDFQWDQQVAGGKAFEAGIDSGVPDETVASIKRTKVALKGPLATPIGYGQRSANVTLRGLFETYANIRPAIQLPNVTSHFQDLGLDLVVVRENVEDLYTGIEYMQTPDVALSLKLVSRKGCIDIVRAAFEYARSAGRKKVHCATKANIMKKTEGLLKSTFEEISSEYPDIETDHILIDNCAHQMAIHPEQFDVVLCSNMNGDIISDLSSGLVGGLGVAPACNLGREYAIFEAVHGTAPDIAGQDKANPSSMILTAVMMCRHLGYFKEADVIEQALKVTLNSGVMTGDLTRENPVGTTAFTDAVVENLGQTMPDFVQRDYKPFVMPTEEPHQVSDHCASCVISGLDVYVDSKLSLPDFVKSMSELANMCRLNLHGIYNRGTKVFPAQTELSEYIEHWQCRFVDGSGGVIRNEDIRELLSLIESHSSFYWMHIEKIFKID